MQTKLRFLTASFVCHLLLAALFFGWRLWHPAERAAPPAVLVDLLPKPHPISSNTGTSPKTARARGGRRNAAASHKAGSSPLPFSALAPRQGFQASRPGEPRAASSGGEDPWSPFTASETGAESGPVPERGALGWIYRKTQYGLTFPQELIRHGIVGRAQARLVFGEDGRFLLPELRVRSDSPYLRVYVYRLLERTFGGEPVPASLRQWKEKLKVDCYVRFALTESGAAVTVDLPDAIVGHRLYFSRTFAKSKLEWDLGPLHGIFPLPAVGVDVLWFARAAKEAVDPSIPVDDLAPYKADPLFSGALD